MNFIGGQNGLGKLRIGVHFAKIHFDDDYDNEIKRIATEDLAVAKSL